MLRLTLTCFFTIIYINYIKCDVCTEGVTDKGCYKVDDWKDNILCRIQVAADANGKNGGYENDVTIGKWDLPLQKTWKNQAKVSFNLI